MEQEGVTAYQLVRRHAFSRGTLDFLKQGRNISTATLNGLCRILGCRVEEVSEYLPDE